MNPVYTISEFDTSELIETHPQNPDWIERYYYNRDVTLEFKKFLGCGVKKVYTQNRKFKLVNGMWDSETFVLLLTNGDYTVMSNSEWASFRSVKVEVKK